MYNIACLEREYYSRIDALRLAEIEDRERSLLLYHGAVLALGRNDYTSLCRSLKKLFISASWNEIRMCLPQSQTIHAFVQDMLKQRSFIPHEAIRMNGGFRYFDNCGKNRFQENSLRIIQNESQLLRENKNSLSIDTWSKLMDRLASERQQIAQASQTMHWNLFGKLLWPSLVGWDASEQVFLKKRGSSYYTPFCEIGTPYRLAAEAVRDCWRSKLVLETISHIEKLPSGAILHRRAFLHKFLRSEEYAVVSSKIEKQLLDLQRKDPCLTKDRAEKEIAQNWAENYEGLRIDSLNACFKLSEASSHVIGLEMLLEIPGEQQWLHLGSILSNTQAVGSATQDFALTLKEVLRAIREEREYVSSSCSFPPSKIYGELWMRVCEKIFIDILHWKPVTDGDWNPLKEKVALLQFLFARYTRYERGSAAIGEWIAKICYAFHGVAMCRELARGIQTVDLAALTCVSWEDFWLQYNQLIDIA